MREGFRRFTKNNLSFKMKLFQCPDFHPTSLLRLSVVRQSLFIQFTSVVYSFSKGMTGCPRSTPNKNILNEMVNPYNSDKSTLVICSFTVFWMSHLYIKLISMVNFYKYNSSGRTMTFLYQGFLFLRVDTSSDDFHKSDLNFLFQSIF